MAKTLKDGRTITNEYGDIWDDAILVADYNNLDFLDKYFRFRIDIYKDSTARTAGYKPYNSTWYKIDKTEFQSNFVQTNAIATVKSQTESYALTLTDSSSNLIYGNDFE